MVLVFRVSPSVVVGGRCLEVIGRGFIVEGLGVIDVRRVAERGQG